MAISLCKTSLQPLTSNEFDILEDFIVLLKPFEKATVDISGEQYTTISLIIPMIRGLYSNLLKNECNLKTESGREMFNVFFLLKIEL